MSGLSFLETSQTKMQKGLKYFRTERKQPDFNFSILLQ